MADGKYLKNYYVNIGKTLDFSGATIEDKEELSEIIRDEMITVRMADYKVARGNQKLITRDLGSCIAIALRDPRKEIGGLLGKKENTVKSLLKRGREQLREEVL